MKKVFVVSYFYAPANMIGAVRMSKVSKYLAELGYDVQVITSENNSLLFQKKNSGFDNILHEDTKDLNVVRIPHGKLYSRLAGLIREHLLARDGTGSGGGAASAGHKKHAFKKWLLHYGLYVLSTIQDFDFAHQGAKYFKQNPAGECVFISSYGPFASHLLVQKVKKNNIWIADFRDPLAQAENYPLERKINRFYEKRVLKKCDAVVGVADSYLKSILDGSGHRKNVITNGFDSHDLQYIRADERKDNKVIFCYTGTLYSGMRDITPFFKVLSSMIYDGEIDRSRIEIHYAGVQGDFFVNLGNSYEIEDLITNHGFVSRNQSLEIQNNSDVIICLTWNIAENIGYLPGKFLEHLMFKKDILGMVTGPYRGSEMKELIEKLNIGICVEAADPEADSKLRNYIRQLYHGNFSKPNQAEVDAFDYINITRRYADLMESLIAERTTHEKNIEK